MKNNQISKSYLEWEEYIKLIRKKENLDFITTTARQSLRNLISREDQL